MCQACDSSMTMKNELNTFLLWLEVVTVRVEEDMDRRAHDSIRKY